MKVINLHIHEFGLLSKAVLRKVFVQPQKGDFYSTSIFKTGGGDIPIYLSDEYHAKLKKDLHRNMEQGKFASSNAEGYWMNMIDKFEDPGEIDSVDTSELNEHEEYD